MKIKLKSWGVFQEIVGERELSVEISADATINALLKRLVAKYGKKLRNELFQPDGKTITPYIKILHNGHGAKLNSKLDDDDVVAIFPPVGGG